MRNKLFRKRVRMAGSLILALVMAVSAPAMAEDVNPEGYPIVDEKITVSMMGMHHPIQGEWADLKFFKTMEEMTNIAFTFDTPSQDVFEEKKSLAIAGESYPEVFFAANLNTTQQVQWGMDICM